MNIDAGIEYHSLDERCEGATGADIKALCTEAGMFAIRDNRDKVSSRDFEQALDKMLHGPKMKCNEAGVMFA
jgi:proteasome regulatory subunit